MKRVFLFFLLYLADINVYAQDVNVDSLITLLKTTPEDTNRLNILEALGDNAPDGEWQKYNEEMGKLSEKLMKSDQPLIQLSGKKHFAVWMNNIATEFTYKGDYKTALEYYRKCAKIQQDIGDKKNLANAFNGIGAVYDRAGDLDNALENYNRSLKIQEEVGDKILLAVTLNNIGMIYGKKNDTSKELKYCLRTLKIIEQNKISDPSVPNILFNIGEIMEKQKKYAEALDYFQRGLGVAEKIGDNNGKASNLRGIGSVYFQQGEIEKALNFSKQSLSISVKEANPADIFQTAQLLKNIYKKQGNFENAFEMYSLEESAHDSLRRKENQEAVIQHKFQYKYDLKEATDKAEQDKKDAIAAAELQKQKIQKYSFFGSAILLFLLAFAFYNRYLFKKRVNKQLEEKNEVITNAFHQLKKHQQQLVEQEKMVSLGQLTAGIAHEINNPINFVSGSITPLKRDINDIITLIEKYSAVDENNYHTKLTEIRKYKKDIDINYVLNEIQLLTSGIEEGSKRTSEIVKGLRHFSRLEEGEKNKTNMNEGLESTLMLLNNKLKHSYIEVIKSFGKIPEVDCYPGQLNQVFMNLILNAIDAIDKNGKITITTSGYGGKVKISIKDTGSGMSEETKKRIFDPFFTTKAVGKGTGLGLSISYGIIEKHNGTIEVNSEFGKGTEFIITLPVEQKR